MILDMLEESFQKNANRTAIIDDNGCYSYRQLYSDADRVAAFMKNHGYGYGHRIGLLMDRSYLSITAMIGILKTGAIYVPINKSNPEARIKSIINMCTLKAIIYDNTQDIFITSEPCFSIHDMLLCNTENTEKFVPNESDLAYILYTSGSTGTPKGVCITYEAFTFFLKWCISEFEISENDHIAAISALTFDLSVFEIYAGLLTGGTVCIASDVIKRWPISFAEFLSTNKISVLYAVPSFLNGLRLYGDVKNHDMSSLRLILFAGEQFWIQQFDALYTAFPKGIEYANLYGPTETNVCTFYRILQHYSKEKEIPIGKILPGLKYHIVKEKISDEYGELVIFGPCIMKYYWGDSTDRHEEHWFIKDGELGYRTGDIVYLDENNNFVLIGRKDDIVKVNGYRVSLNEIKKAILQCRFVEQVYVRTYTKINLMELVAFVKILSYDQKYNINKIRELSKKTLPNYMIPKKIIEVSEFPYTDSGKIDGNLLMRKYDLI